MRFGIGLVVHMRLCIREVVKILETLCPIAPSGQTHCSSCSPVLCSAPVKYFSTSNLYFSLKFYLFEEMTIIYSYLFFLCFHIKYGIQQV